MSTSTISTMVEDMPFSKASSPASQPILSEIHLWRVQPREKSLHEIIPPSKGQKPIAMSAQRISGRKVVVGVWAVANGEAISVRAYDPKAVETFDLTIVSGWWAELELPPLIAMTEADLDGLAAYVTQGISLQIPEPDYRGRVDMSRAFLRFTSGPPSPPFDVNPIGPDRRYVGKNEGVTATEKHAAPVVWKGLRKYRSRAVLIACARESPSVMIVRGWDSSMAWRMTNLITFHEEAWKAWNLEKTGLERTFTKLVSKKEDTTDPEKRDYGSDDVPDTGIKNATCIVSGGDVERRWSGAGRTLGRSTLLHPDSEPVYSQAGTDRLCQGIADRIEIAREGNSGRIALKPPHRKGRNDGREENAEEAGGGEEGGGLEVPFGGSGRRGSVGVARTVGGGLSGDDTMEDVFAQLKFLSYKDMEQRMKAIGQKGTKTEKYVPVGRTGLVRPRRPLEDRNSYLGKGEEEDRSINQVVQQMRTSDKLKEQLAAANREKVINKWKVSVKVLCRLLRMSDYWYGFAAHHLSSSNKTAPTRMSVLRMMVEMRTLDGGSSAMKTLVRAFMERYPNSVWSRFRSLMRQPKHLRCRRDMCVCAILLSEIDNPFFRYITADWPFSRLVNFISDTKFVEKADLAVLYDEGETAERNIDGNLQGVTKEQHQPGKYTPPTSLGNGIGLAGASGGGIGGRSEGGGSGVGPEERWTVGAYLLLRGAVDLYVLERGPAAERPTATSQDDLATKASRGQPMYRPRPPAEWKEAKEAVEAAMADDQSLKRNSSLDGRYQRQAIVESVEAEFKRSGPGPRRPRTRNLSPRWKACRLGPGALFGDRHVFSGLVEKQDSHVTGGKGSVNVRGCGSEGYSNGAGSGNQSRGKRLIYSGPMNNRVEIAAPRLTPALETAITIGNCELLEIGADSYRKMLAKGAKERVGRAVDVLKGTGALDGIPTPALERICRYATDKTVGPMASNPVHPPFANPSAATSMTFDHSGDCLKTVCRKGDVRGAAFFVAEGDGEVIIDGPRLGLGGCFLGSPSSSGGGRRKRRRRVRPEIFGRGCSQSEACGGQTKTGSPKNNSGADVQETEPFLGYSKVQGKHLAVEREGGKPFTAEAESRRLENTAESCGRVYVSPETQASLSASLAAPLSSSVGGGWDTVSGNDWWFGAGERRSAATTVAVLEKGDFFGVVPALQASEKSASNDQNRAVEGSSHTTTSPRATKHTGSSSLASGMGVTVPNATRPGVMTTDYPPAIAMVAEDPPSLEFPGLHKVSLVAGPRGARCLEVRLAVLQKLCPPVHQRLVKVADKRYSRWIGEAELRDEDEWNTRFEDKSVPSLSTSFYKSFARRHISGGVASKGLNDLASSVGGPSLDGNGYGSVDFGGGGGGGACEGSAGRAIRPIPPSRSFTAKKSIFDLSRRFRELVQCSSARTVVPVRLGRALPLPSSWHHGKRSSPCAVDDSRGTARNRELEYSPRAIVANVANVNSPSSVAAAFAAATSKRRGPTPLTKNPATRLTDPQPSSVDLFVKEVLSKFVSSPPQLDGHALISAGATSGVDHGSCPLVTTARIYDNMLPGSVTEKVSTTSTSVHVGGFGAGDRERFDDHINISNDRVLRGSIEAGASRENSDGGAEIISRSLPSGQELDPWDCPVSPFSSPPSWAEVPFSNELEPPVIERRSQVVVAMSAKEEGHNNAEQIREVMSRAAETWEPNPLLKNSQRSFSSGVLEQKWRPMIKATTNKVLTTGRPTRFRWRAKGPCRGRRQRSFLAGSSPRLNRGGHMKGVVPA